MNIKRLCRLYYLKIKIVRHKKISQTELLEFFPNKFHSKVLNNYSYYEWKIRKILIDNKKDHFNYQNIRNYFEIFPELDDTLKNFETKFNEFWLSLKLFNSTVSELRKIISNVSKSNISSLVNNMTDFLNYYNNLENAGYTVISIESNSSCIKINTNIVCFYIYSKQVGTTINAVPKNISNMILGIAKIINL